MNNSRTFLATLCIFSMLRHASSYDGDCYECRGTSDDGPCGRNVTDSHPSVTKVSCEGWGGCQISYERNATNTVYRRWCDDSVCMASSYNSMGYTANDTAVGEVGMVVCCKKSNLCNREFEWVRCYSCTSGSTYSNLECSQNVGRKIFPPLCNGICQTLVTREESGSLSYTRGCVDHCDPYTAVQAGTVNGSSVVHRQCCKDDLCNGSNRSLPVDEHDEEKDVTTHTTSAAATFTMADILLMLMTTSLLGLSSH